MSDDQGHQPSGGDAGTERALDELRAALEQLATRMGAGFREDLAEIRAIAASVADRDLTPHVEALRVDVATLVGRDTGSEVRAELAAVRATLDRVSARLDAVPTASQARDLLEQLQDNLADVASGEVVGALWDEVRRLRADLPDLVAVPDPVATAPAASEPDPQLAALLDELAVLRSELDEGLVVEPSDALTASLDALRTEVDGLRSRLEELRLAPEPEPAAVRGADVPDVEALADQIAALRDFVASELDTLEQTMSARLDSQAEATAATVAAAATSRPEPAPAVAPPPAAAPLDPDTVELLRAEIRAAGAIGDQVIDALREELKALRRRIAVKASERVLDDQQLAQIADAVVARLAADG